MSGEPDEEDSSAESDAMQEHAKALYELVSGYMDESDLDEKMTSQLLSDIAVRMRMVGYGIEDEDPSVAGLKNELDHFRRDLDELIKECKNGAEEFIENVKEFRESALDDEDEDDEAEDDDFDEDDEDELIEIGDDDEEMEEADEDEGGGKRKQ